MRPALHSCVAGLLLACALSAQQTVDQWSDKSRWRSPDGWFGVAVHAVLLPDGRVFCVGYERDTEDPDLATDQRRAAFTFVPEPAFTPASPDLLVQEQNDPLEIEDYFDGRTFVSDDLFCTGQTLDADGRVFTAGGTRFAFDSLTGDSVTIGLGYATLFFDTSWVRWPLEMQVSSPFVGAPARWYPTVTRLPDRRLLVTGGYDVVNPTPNHNRSAEVFDPDTGQWTVLSGYGEAPIEMAAGNYTHVEVLPRKQGDFDFLMFADAGTPVFLALDSEPRWAVSAHPRPNTVPGQSSGAGSTSTLLPLRLQDGQWGYANGSMILAGSSVGGHRARADVYDPAADGWLPRILMGIRRTDPTAVLLPDGRVAIVGGHDQVGLGDVAVASYIDPSQGFAHALGTSSGQEVRGYHNVALLLPDGRILAGGGRDQETEDSAEKSSFRTLYPSYMFAERPVIQSVRSELRYGSRARVVVEGNGISEVVLMALGAMTHSFDSSQRSVQLAIERFRPGLPGTQAITVRGPENGRSAPPGYYMLFVLDRERIPSVAKIVRVE